MRLNPLPIAARLALPVILVVLNCSSATAAEPVLPTPVLARLPSPAASAAVENTSTPAPVAVPAPTSTSTATPTVAPTLTPTPLPTRTVRFVQAEPSATVPRHHTDRLHHTGAGASTEVPATAGTSARAGTPATPEASATAHAGAGPAKKRHHHKRLFTKTPTVTPTPTETPTVTPTATPAVSNNAEDSISPVTCNGPGKPMARHPFLYPPYHGWSDIVSYFDHDSPNFYQDGLVIAGNGEEARYDGDRASDFPAYWDTHLRQYLYYDGHNGYDYDVSYVPLYAAAAGTVIYADWEYPTMPDHGYGKMVMINHHNGYVTLYGHMSDIIVKKGERVRRGQLLGISGNTGHSSGPHVHFTVFHNCSPTDPYGWSSPAGEPDPLQTYQGEVSEYLWVKQPLVDNPLPDYPGLSLLPSGGPARLVLLELPPVKRGVDDFTRRIARRIHRAIAALGPLSRYAHPDPLLDAVWVAGGVPAQRLYRLPFVASVAADWVGVYARHQVLRSLARAALVKLPSHLKLRPAHGWTSTIIQWQGQTLVVGQGPKKAELRVPVGGKDRRIHTDSSSGAYALDLGKLSSKQVASLRHALTPPTAMPVPTNPASTPTVTSRSSRGPVHGRSRSDRGREVMVGLAIIMLLAAGITTGALRWRQRGAR